MAYEDSLLRRPFFPSAEKLKEWGSALVNAFTPAATSIPAAGPFTPTAAIPQPTVDGTKIPLPFSQLRYTGPLLGTGPQFGLRGTPAPAPQPEPVKTDIGAYAATRFPFSFDVAKTQTPSMQQPDVSALTGSTALPSFAAPVQTPFTPTKLSARRTDTATKYGTVSATPRQLLNFNERETANVSRTPAQQQALLAQMRQKGRDMAGAQNQFFAQKKAERDAILPSAIEAKMAGASPQSIRAASRSYSAAQPSSIAGIQRAAYAARQTGFNPQSAVASVRGTFGLPTGGPQPQQQFAPSSFTPSFANFNPFSNINYPRYNG